MRKIKVIFMLFTIVTIFFVIELFSSYSIVHADYDGQSVSITRENLEHRGNTEGRSSVL